MVACSLEAWSLSAEKSAESSQFGEGRYTGHLPMAETLRRSPWGPCFSRCVRFPRGVAPPSSSP
eukprot:14737093-Alexandrium_andersonii.AAC.1